MLSEIDGDNPPLAAIFGIAGTTLTAEEREFFQTVNPLGFILFARNFTDPAQARALTDSLRACIGREVPILIDQEGGRVQRLKPPHWKQYPPAGEFGTSFMADFAKGRAALDESMSSLATELADAGINVNCAPVLDVRFPETHPAIGDRAFGNAPEAVAALGAAVCETFLAAGVVPVVKHMPGLGRADLDTHKDLPAVTASLEDLEIVDFRPFRDMQTRAFSEAVWGMISHAIYNAVDERAPASCSRKVIRDIIRGAMGFDGLLLSDDLSMDALAQYGGVPERAEMVLRGGCDIALHCNGKLDEMQAMAARIGKMTNDAVIRYNRSASWVRRNFSNG
ncbi:MAG TPA: beta-N-acetylhexosaminidase [Alphaproteobacteria bacterium]